jgi:ubiquinone/menaquinone biosynthesis C-methylase UbiE
MINKKDIPYKYRSYKDKEAMRKNANINYDEYVTKAIPKHVENLKLCSDDIVLDIGSGCGDMAKIISPLVRKVYCCDINDQYLSYAKDTCKSVDNVSFYLVNDLKFPLLFLPDSVITKGYAVSVLIHNCTETIINYLHELKRVLKPEGTFSTTYCVKGHDKKLRPGIVESNKKDVDLAVDFLKFRVIKNIEYFNGCDTIVELIIQKKC